MVPVAGAAPVRISVVIRTIGRPSIAQSLRSLAAQRLPPAEVVIVRARAGELPALPALDPIDVRIVGGGALNCPQAANVGLDAALGTHVVFLDDDDTFDPDHLASLAAALEAEPGARVAYSGTLGVDLQGQTLGDLAYGFDRLLLFKRNYIQMGAALFERSLVLEGCRFDETLDAFEDWDFWLQLSTRTSFAFTGRLTNRWSILSGESGTGAPDAAKSERLNRFQARLTAKWAAERADLVRRISYWDEKARASQAAGRKDAEATHREAIRRLLSGTPVEPERSG